jgi:DNA-binding NtrC family response regulator
LEGHATVIRHPITNGDEWLSLDELERDHIARTLAHTFNNRSAAARLLGITRQALLRKMKRHGLALV